MEQKELAVTFTEYLRKGKNLELIEITADIAESAGNLRGKYQSLRTLDAIQIAAAIDAKAEVFLTNDKGLRKIREIEVIVLSDYIS
jgi:predicted nucleic acid-binding protein